MENKDMLNEIFEKQKDLMVRLRVMGKAEKEQIPHIKELTLAAMVELGEMIQELKWKSWKLAGANNWEKYQMELIDVFHFVIELAILGGLNAESLYAGYIDKNEVNQDRISHSY